MSDYRINLHEAIYSLSDALDLVGVTHIHHGKRVAYMAVEFGKYLGWERPRLDDLFQAAILHDCGVSRTTVHAKLAQFEWEHEEDHCLAGARLLASCPMLACLSPIILHHHTHWPLLLDMDIPEEAKLAANCIYIADRVDILTLKFLNEEVDILLGKEEIRKKVAEKCGEWFCRELVDAFLDVSRSEAFWFSLETGHLEGYVSTWLSETAPEPMSFDELRSLARVFSSIVDAKSPFTREHSDRVASLARHVGTLFGLSNRKCEMLELAGLLHDIGKLRIPDELLEKPGKFTEAERNTVLRHSFDTYSILRNIRGLEEVSLWASQHHERMDGTGYPYRLKKTGLSLEARIIEASDVFQALAQRRPYRDSLPPGEIMEMIRGEVAGGRLDSEVVSRMEAHLDTCWRISMGLQADDQELRDQGD